MTAYSYLISDIYRNGLTLNITPSDTLELIAGRFTNELYCVGNDARNVLPASMPLTNTTYWKKITDYESLDVYQTNGAISFPPGNWEICLGYYDFDDYEFVYSNKIMLTVTQPPITVTLTAGHTYIVSTKGTITASLSSTTLTVSQHSETFDVIDLGAGTGSNIVVLLAQSSGVTTLYS